MSEDIVEIQRTPEGNLLLIFRKALSQEHAGDLWVELSRLLKERRQPGGIILDLEAAEPIDSTGISLLRLLYRHCRRQGIQLEYRSIPTSAEYFLRYVETGPTASEAPPPLSMQRAISGIGKWAILRSEEWKGLIRFIGDVNISVASGLLHPGRFRWKETLYYAQISGADAMPIIFLLSFLIGLVMAFQAAVQLRQFGANIFVADLVSLALARELGPVFTALTLAGRSGSAYAAEIGTMKINEELDALRVMGFNITQFIVLPKVFALIICGPLLTLWANAAGIAGGVVVGVLSLDLTARSFLEEVYQILTLWDVGTGLIKSVAFAFLISLIGCFRGIQTEKGADSVGRQTTSAVVSGTTLVIFADAVFTILFHVLDW